MNLEKEKQFNFPLLVQLSLFINSNMRKKILFKLFIELNTQQRVEKSSVNKIEFRCFLKQKLTIKKENETDFFKTLYFIFFSL